ncbi:MAG: SMC-Scp complex subunit ScpB [Lachnospiraceae bacterium]|nr:SMC-Scp complex subunit ScpB [Lachnospiraceae bacterium]
MEEINKKAALEAILFAMGESVELKKLAETIEAEPAKTKELLNELMEEYKDDSHGIELIELEDSYQFVTKSAYYDTLIKIAKTPKKMNLSDSVLETLSIVAYKQPVTKIEIENIRGVSCDYAINKLLEFELIEELGRKDAPGRPMLFGTTEQFLRSFGVKSLKDLPEMNVMQLEEFKAQAEQEVQMTLKI